MFFIVRSVVPCRLALFLLEFEANLLNASETAVFCVFITIYFVHIFFYLRRILFVFPIIKICVEEATGVREKVGLRFRVQLTSGNSIIRFQSIKRSLIARIDVHLVINAMRLGGGYSTRQRGLNQSTEGERKR